MLTVYLDQNKWIDLAKAAVGRPDGQRYQQVLASATAAVERGQASFPLDTSRYMETSKRNWASRQDLVSTMAALSRFHAIAPQQVILPVEIDAALHARFGVPEHPRAADVFGVGANHAFGGGLDLDLPLPPGLPPAAEARLRAEFRQVLEHGLLLGPTPEMQDSEEHRRLMERMTQDAEFAAGRAVLAARLAETGYDKRERLDRAILATQLQDILQPLLEALRQAGIDPDRFIEDMGREGLVSFLADLPSRAVTVDLLKDKHAQGEQEWEPNDLNDVVSLPAAAVYCDVIVTEKQWANRMRRAKIPARYGTTVLNDLADLTPLLAAAGTAT